jgi:hypothetical protein
MREIVWTAKAKEALSPRRGARRRAIRCDRDKLVGALRAGLATNADRMRLGASKGYGDPALTLATLAHVEALVADESTPIDGRLLGAARVAFQWQGVDAAAHAITLSALLVDSIASALRALVSELGLSVWYAVKNGMISFDAFSLTTSRDPAAFIARLDDWEALRAQVVTADEATYAAAREEAASLRATGSPVQRAAIAFAFPDEPSWADEDARVFLDSKELKEGGHRTAWGLPLIASMSDVALAVKVLDRAAIHASWLPTFGHFAADAVRLVGELATPSLRASLAITDQPEERWKWWANDLKNVIVALSLFAEPTTSSALAPLVDHKIMGPAIVDYFRATPAEAVRALAPKLLEAPKKAARALELLGAAARSEPEIVREASLALADPRERAAVEKLLVAKAAPADQQDASLDELPRVLRDPPWRSKAKRPVLRVIEGLATLPYEERVDRDALKTDAPWWAQQGLFTTEELTKLEALLAASIARGERPRNSSTLTYVAVHRLLPERALAIWNGTPHWAFSMGDFGASYLLRRHGVAALKGAIALAEQYGDPDALEALTTADTPHAARAMARALKRRSTRTIAMRWLTRQPRAASIGLIPLALGAPSRDRDVALEALRVLARNGHEETLRAAAKSYGEEIASAVDDALTFDPLLVCPTKPPKLSPFFVAEALPRLTLKNGHTLPTEQVEILGEILQFSPIDPPYAGLAEVKAALAPAPLAEFLWSLLEAWIQAGGLTGNAWPMTALGHLGGDAIVRRLAPAIRRWPREKAKPRALMGLDALAMIGSDTALMHLATLAEKAKNVHVEDRAKALLTQVAEARGLDQEGLEDRLVPDLGLDAHGRLLLDFGPRSFEVRFSAQMEPEIFDGSTRLKSIPRVTKDDDADKAKAAQALWKGLREDGKAVIASLSARLERAMCDGRAWEAASFRALMIEHPLTQLFARRLVWAIVDDEGVILSTFRVAEDSSLASIDDDALTLEDDALIALPHAMRLDSATRARWGEVLSSYEILQPFAQIGRELIAKPEGKSVRLEPLPTRDIPYHVLAGTLESRGWKRVVNSESEGRIDTFEKRVVGETATLAFSPPAYFREAPPERVTISVVSFDREVGRMKEIAYSEIARDLRALE